MRLFHAHLIIIKYYQNISECILMYVLYISFENKMTDPSTGKKYLPLSYSSLDNLKTIGLDFALVIDCWL